jgi:short-subunit dehydrogenase
MTDRVTLITGAAAGIGTELARVFASRRHRLALVDRRADRLAMLASEIVAAGGAAPILIPCDLEHPDACDKIAAALAAERVEVEFVVNNAGFGLFGHAIELDRAEQLGIIVVNILALTDLSLRFSDSLIRHRGGILNVGSLAGFLPGPGMAVYYASKAYVLSFSEALRQELAPRGVRVTTLCPGSVSTEFQARAGIKPGLEHEILNVSASDVAQAGYRGLMANKRAALPGFGVKVVPFLLRLFPRGFILAAIGHIQLRSADSVGRHSTVTSASPGNFARRANQQNPVQSLCENNSLSPSGKSKLEVPPSCPEEGRWPSSRTLGRDAVDAAAWRTLEIAGRDEPRERSRRARRAML